MRIPIRASRGGARRFPYWLLADELGELNLDPRVQGLPSICSHRVFIARQNGNGTLLALKYMGQVPSGFSNADMELLSLSIQGASKIKSEHRAFANLVSSHWTKLGLVLASEYLPNSVTLEQHKVQNLDQLLIILIQVADALRHIICSESAHCDVTASNVLVSARPEAFLVDYDLAFPIRHFYRSSYEGFNPFSTLEERQHMDVQALEGLATSTIYKYLLNDAISDCKTEEPRTRQALRTLAGLTTPRLPLARLRRLTDAFQQL